MYARDQIEKIMTSSSEKTHLSRVEFDQFEGARKLVAILWALCLGLGLLAATLKIAFNREIDVDLAVGLTFILTIMLLVAMFRYKCPRCGTNPMIERVSVATGEIEVGGFVALHPKRCTKCGVMFTQE